MHDGDICCGGKDRVDGCSRDELSNTDTIAVPIDVACTQQHGQNGNGEELGPQSVKIGASDRILADAERLCAEEDKRFVRLPGTPHR